MKHILLIDDEADIRETLRKKLEQNGFDVSEAGSVADGIAVIKQTPIDLIVVDLVMPTGHGSGLAYELKAIGRENIPVIILSNVDSTSYPDNVKEYLIKSDTSLDRIVSRISYHLGISD
jgi:two-component system response regulator MprA